MIYLFLVTFIAGLLLAVRLMFFGAERKRRRNRSPGAMPLRRSEPAMVAFLVIFGGSGYLLLWHRVLSIPASAAAATTLGVLWAAIVMRIAIAMARVTPAHDPDDPRYGLQGQVAIVTVPIASGGEGTILYGSGQGNRTVRARSIDAGAIADGVEVCIERIDDGVAFVEAWAVVEARL